MEKEGGRERPTEGRRQGGRWEEELQTERDRETLRDKGRARWRDTGREMMRG